jgi:hypothetical protein
MTDYCRLKNKTDTWQTRPLVREGAPKNDKTETFKKKKSLVKSPIFGLDTKTYWLTDRQSQSDFDFDFDFVYISLNCVKHR